MFGSTWWAGGFGWGWFWGVDVDLWDIFEQFFGWAGGWFWHWRKRSTEFKWEDLEEIISIDLKTSIYWWKQKIKINKLVTCPDCKWVWWEGKKTCPDCHWSWQVTYTRQSLFWVIQQTAACEKCNATWEIFEKVCEKCNWQKRVRDTKQLDLDIPAGIDNWMVIKLEWEWNDWVGTKASWDLYIKFRVNTEEKGLKRKWVNLYYKIEIDVVEAVLWTKKEISIPVIWKRTIDISNWTQAWTVLKISGDWVKYIDKDAKWDLFITINIKIPKKLGKKEKELYFEIAKEKKINVVNHKWIFEKLFG
jgi:molecular chaperone DnaJ